MIAAAGVFIELSEDANLPWRWEEVSNKLQEIIADQNDDQFFNNFSFVAKTNADHSKLITKNKSYCAPWTSRICDLINKLKIELDNDKYMENITKLFLASNQTPKRPSQGLNFKDVYLDNSFNIAPRHPDNDCYVRVPHRYNIVPEDFDSTKYTFDEYK